MELLSISQIKELNNIDDYKAYLVQCHSLNDSIVTSILHTIKNSQHLECPVSLSSYNCLLHSLCNNYNAIVEWGITNHFCNDPHLHCLWVKKENEIKSIFIEEALSIDISDKFRMLDAGISFDELGISNSEEIYASLSNEDIEYLRELGILHKVEDTVPDEYLIDQSTTRFSSAVWFEAIQKESIMIAGVGGIGSFASFLLSRTHPKEIFMIDPDKVEAVNMAGQMFSRHSLGMNKVDAMAYNLDQFSNYNTVYCINERYTEETAASNIMICGFDNMYSRELFFNRWKHFVSTLLPELRKECLFIDGRLAAEYLQVFCIRGDDAYNMERYAQTFLFSDEEAEETICSYKQTSYMASMIGSIITNLFINFTANKITENLRDLPFITTYDGCLMLFKTEN